MHLLLVVVYSLSRVQLLVIPCSIACQPLLSMGFSRQEYWSGLPFPSAGDLLTQESNPGLLHCRQILLPTELRWKPFYVLCPVFKKRFCFQSV